MKKVVTWFLFIAICILLCAVSAYGLHVIRESETIEEWGVTEIVIDSSETSDEFPKFSNVYDSNFTTGTIYDSSYKDSEYSFEVVHFGYVNKSVEKSIEGYRLLDYQSYESFCKDYGFNNYFTNKGKDYIVITNILRGTKNFLLDSYERVEIDNNSGFYYKIVLDTFRNSSAYDRTAVIIVIPINKDDAVKCEGAKIVTNKYSLTFFTKESSDEEFKGTD